MELTPEKAAQSKIIMELTPEKAAQLNDAAMRLVGTTMGTVGIDNTIIMLNGMADLVAENPAYARKLADPVMQAKLVAFGAKYKGTEKPNVMQMFAIAGEMGEIFG